ncbi:hypothetical protein H6F67_19635 [Microcoleus sp. FACHB-1515]|nr:hypothetical protein [Microcoleus sp. FACHB-1515]
MPIDPDKTTRVMISMPKPLAKYLRQVAKSRAISLSQLMLQATLDRYPPPSEATENEDDHSS